jgi:2-polyprenyl-3-methyl-5-hydroxy-6-metoxy-1,4-benzoquinol methylase
MNRMGHTIEHEEVVARTALRFARATERKWTYHYVASKLRRDPSTRAIAELGPLGDVVDIGCGRGQLNVYLLEAGLARSVQAFDWDDEKIALAKRAAEGLEASFEVLDARNASAKAPGVAADTVLLIDVLHYLDVAAQDDLLRSAAEMVRPGGRLVVREATTRCGWRSVVTVCIEWISKLVRLNIGERISIRDVSREIVPLLEAKGMTCTVEPCWKGTPFSNVLLVAAMAS